MTTKGRIVQAGWRAFLVRCLLATVTLAVAQESKYHMTAPEHLQVSEKLVYNYTHRKYDPPVVVDLSKEGLQNDTPEDAAISLTRAMARGDYAGFNRGWTPESLKIMDAKDKENHQGPEFWTKAWLQAFKGRKVEMRDRVDTGNYVIIDMISMPLNSTSPNDLGEIPWVLVKDAKGHWLGTQDLSSDPVLKDWPRPNSVMVRVIR